MVNIGATDFYLNVPSLPRGEFEEYSTQLFDDWENHVASVLELPDYSLSLNVEEGSIKALSRIAAAAGVIYLGIGQYGSFISGLEIIQTQVRSVSDYFSERASAPFNSGNVSPKVWKRGESLTRLQNLFAKVQRGELTVEGAMSEAEAIFGPDASSVPGLMADLEESFEQTPLLPQQIQLPLENAEGELLLSASVKKKKFRLSTPREPAPGHDQYRVEVWRDSRKGKRNVRIVSL